MHLSGSMTKEDTLTMYAQAAILYGKRDDGGMDVEEIGPNRWGGVGNHHYQPPHPNHAQKVKGSGAGIAAASALSDAIEDAFVKVFSEPLRQQFEAYMENEGKSSVIHSLPACLYHDDE